MEGKGRRRCGRKVGEIMSFHLIMFNLRYYVTYVGVWKCECTERASSERQI